MEEPKANERLSNLINRVKRSLEDQKDKEGTKNLPVLKRMRYNSTGETEMFTRNDSSELLEDKSLGKNYLMWENNSNLCWLNSSMSLLAHNKTLHRFVNTNSSQIANIIKGYERAISVYNDNSNESTVKKRQQTAKSKFQKIQAKVLKYLKPIREYKKGGPDAAFYCLLNLIKEEMRIKKLFLVEFLWIKGCTKCVCPRLMNPRTNKKTIITLSKVRAFNPCSPVFLYKCPVCKSLDQEVEIKYKSLPQCLIFHFKNGAGEGDLGSLDFEFELNCRKYKLSGLIKLEKGQYSTINHLVAWIRDIVTGRWLERNDLNSDILSFSVAPPVINLRDLYFVMYEALDNKGTLYNVSADTINIDRMDLDDASSSCIPDVDITSEGNGVEFDQNNPVTKDHLESFAVSKIEKISSEISKLSLDLQDNSTFTSGEKNDSLLPMDVVSLLPMDSKSVNINSQHNDRNRFKDSTAENMKQSLLKNIIDIQKGLENISFVFANAEKASFAKPVLENNVKTSKQNSEKPLVRTIEDNLNNAPTSDDAKKSVETSTFPDLTVHSPTQKQLQQSDLSALPEDNKLFSSAVGTTKKKEDSCVLEGKSVDSLESETQHITVSKGRENCQEQLENGMFAKRNATITKCETFKKILVVTQKSLKIQNFPERTCRTHSTSEDRSGISSTESQKTTKRKLSSDINSENDAKEGNSDSQMRFPTTFPLGIKNSDQVAQYELKTVLRVPDPPNGSFLGPTFCENFALTYDDFAVENEMFPCKAFADNLNNAPTSDDAKKSVETSTFPDLAVHTKNFPERTCRTHSTSEDRSGISGIESQKTTKKKLSSDINSDNDAKAGNSDSQIRFLPALTLRITNSNQAAQYELKTVLSVPDPPMGTFFLQRMIETT